MEIQKNTSLILFDIKPVRKNIVKTLNPRGISTSGTELPNFSLPIKKSTVRDPIKSVVNKIEELTETAYKTTDETFTLSNGKDAIFKIFHGTQSGSNLGFYALDEKNNQLYYAKIGGQQSVVECLASEIYKLAGVGVPDMQLIKTQDGKIGLISKFIPELKPVRIAKDGVVDGYATDALLANWDAVCSSNVLENASGFYRVDFGGSLDFRAKGEHKDFNIVVDELTSLIDYDVNPRSASLFGKLNREKLIASLESVANISDNDIIEVCKKYDCSEYQEVLLKRKEYLTYFLELVKKTPQDDMSLIEYLSKIKDKLLNTPLYEFSSYKGAVKQPK